MNRYRLRKGTQAFKSIDARTLHVSDLDGTLLQPNQTISPWSIEVLGELLERGLRFTFATARSWATVLPLVSALPLREPVILSNGLMVYDLARQTYVLRRSFEPAVVQKILAIMHGNGLTPLVYAHDDLLHSRVWMRSVANGWMDGYYQDRLRHGDQRFGTLAAGQNYPLDQVFTAIAIDSRERLEDAARRCRELGLAVYLSENIYWGGWWLEVGHPLGNKGEGVSFLRRHCNVDRVICFGDQENDLSMFRAADEGLAVENAVAELKQSATGIIGPNTADGVAHWLAATYGLQ